VISIYTAIIDVQSERMWHSAAWWRMHLYFSDHGVGDTEASNKTDSGGGFPGGEEGRRVVNAEIQQTIKTAKHAPH